MVWRKAKTETLWLMHFKKVKMGEVTRGMGLSSWIDGWQKLWVKKRLSPTKKKKWIGFVDKLLPQKRFLYKAQIKAEDVENAQGKGSGCFWWVSVNNYKAVIEKPMKDLSIASDGQNSRDKNKKTWRWNEAWEHRKGSLSSENNTFKETEPQTWCTKSKYSKCLESNQLQWRGHVKLYSTVYFRGCWNPVNRQLNHLLYPSVYVPF